MRAPSRTLATIASIALFSAVSLASRESRAACGANADVVYLSGSTAAKPFIAALAKVLYKDAQPLTIVYVSSGSCTGVDAVLNGTPASGAASYWDPASTKPDNEESCTVGGDPDAGMAGVGIDVGISDVFATSCFSLINGLPPDVGDFFGPVQPFVFLTPKMSTQRSISATAAYFVYGFGAQSGVTPWTDPLHMFRRNATSGSQALIAAATGVASADFKGVDAMSAANMVALVSASTAPEATIGFAATTDVTDMLLVNVLAYKHYGQTCGYYPSSTQTSRDMLNVREGRYALWGPIHFFSKTDSSGYAKNPLAKRVINYLTGTQAPPGGLDLLQIEQSRNLVPTCAMKATRSTEMGALKPYSGQNQCGCYFQALSTGKAGSSCQACTKNIDCPMATPTCNFGYCEAQ